MRRQCGDDRARRARSLQAGEVLLVRLRRESARQPRRALLGRAVLLLETNGARTLGAAAGNGARGAAAGNERDKANRLPARTSLFVTYYSFG